MTQSKLESLEQELRLARKNEEFHAFSVRQLIVQRARLFELLEFIGRISHFDDRESVATVADQIRHTGPNSIKIFCACYWVAASAMASSWSLEPAMD